MWQEIIEFAAPWTENFALELSLSVFVALIEAPILVLCTQLLKVMRATRQSWFWEFAHFVLFVVLLGVLLRVNADTFDYTEVVTLSVFLIATLLFEGFLKWRAIHRQNRVYLRVIYNTFVIYACLHATATSFDITEIATIVEFFALDVLYEIVRQRGKKEEKDDIRYEINRKIDRQQLRGLLSSNEIQLRNVNWILSRSFIHVAAFIEVQMVGFLNLVWSGEGPAEVDYLAVNPNVHGVTEQLLRLVEAEVGVAGISEVQVSNKVIRQDQSLQKVLTESSYQFETCMVKEL